MKGGFSADADRAIVSSKSSNNFAHSRQGALMGEELFRGVSTLSNIFSAFFAIATKEDSPGLARY